MFRIKTAALIILLMAGAAFAESFKDYDPDGVIFKAGPTEPHEELSIPWLETVLYPKNVEAGKEFFVEVALASKVNKITASLDQKDTYQLFQEDNLSWNAAIKPPKDLKEGLHFLEVEIEGASGRKISRTLAFRVLGSQAADKNSYSYPVALTEDTPLSRNRMLKSGEKVEALFKQTYYWVKTKDGKEGWVLASKIAEPKREIYVQAYLAYEKEDYEKALAYYHKVVMIDPSDADANYWLAKTYNRIGDENNTVKYLRAALDSSAGHRGANLLAANLSRGYFRAGNTLLGMGRIKEAISNFAQAVNLRPGSISYRLALGGAYEKNGQREEAQQAWKQVLLIDPDNRNVHALLHTDFYKLLADEEGEIYQLEKKSTVSSAGSHDLAKEYINVVRQSRTDKGTLISSAIGSVVSMTKSLGTQIYEEGWKTNLSQRGFFVTYACRQERLGKAEPENFVFKVDLDSRKVVPYNKNARLLMHRW